MPPVTAFSLSSAIFALAAFPFFVFAAKETFLDLLYRERSNSVSVSSLFPERCLPGARYLVGSSSYVSIILSLIDEFSEIWSGRTGFE